MENTENKKPKTLLRVLVIGIIIILLILISIGIVKIVPKVLNSIANASLSVGSLLNTRPDSNSDQTNQNSTSTATSSGEGFSIRDLTNINQTTNNFVPAPGGQSNYPTSSISVTAVSNSQNQNSNTSTSSNNQSNTSTSNHLSNTNTTTNTNTQTNSTVKKTSTINTVYTNSPTRYTIGNSDLAVEIVSVGIIDSTTGNFVTTNSFTNEDMIVVKFKVENRGQYATGLWSARVNMPTSDTNQVRYLNNNKSIPAGSAITGEARFNNANIGNQTFSISVDTTQTTKDINRNNNTIVINLSINQNYYSNPNPYYQYNNYNYPNQYYYNNYNYGYGSGYGNQYWYGSNYPTYNCGPYDIYTGQYIGYTNNCNY